MSDVTTRFVPPRWLVAWAALGVALAAAGALPHAPPIAPAFVVASCVLAVTAYRRAGATRAWADGLPLPPLVAVHAVRLVIGALFLVEYSRGHLPAAFAVRGGVGDIIVGALAVPTALAAHRRGWVRAFSLFGLADIVLVFGTAMYLLLVARDPLMTAGLSQTRYALLPLGVVPAVILSHALVLARLRPGRSPILRGASTLPR